MSLAQLYNINLSLFSFLFNMRFHSNVYTSLSLSLSLSLMWVIGSQRTLDYYVNHKQALQALLTHGLYLSLMGHKWAFCTSFIGTMSQSCMLFHRNWPTHPCPLEPHATPWSSTIGNTPLLGLFIGSSLYGLLCVCLTQCTLVWVPSTRT